MLYKLTDNLVRAWRVEEWRVGPKSKHGKRWARNSVSKGLSRARRLKAGTIWVSFRAKY